MIGRHYTRSSLAAVSCRRADGEPPEPATAEELHPPRRSDAPGFISECAVVGTMKRIISSQAAPEAVGAYSQATTNGDLVFTAGQIPMTPEGELLDGEPIAAQTEQSLSNVAGVLSEENLDMSDVLKVTIFLDDIEDFDEMNETYAEFFDDEPPARSAVEVANLPKGVGIEIEAVASND